MNKYIIIISFLVFFISCFIVWNLLHEREEIKKTYIIDKKERNINRLKETEGLSLFSSNQSKEEQNSASEIVKEINGYNQTNSKTHLDSKYNTLSLNQMSVFSSWNTACSGKFVSQIQIVNVLASGCRMVHFKVSNFEGEPMIFGEFFKEKKDGILLNDALKTTSDHAYRHKLMITTSSGKKEVHLSNYQDPLFVMLSFHHFSHAELKKYNENRNNGIPNPSIIPEYPEAFLDKCAEYINSSFKHRLYEREGTGAIPIYKNTKMYEIKEKTIVFTDITTFNQKEKEDFQKTLLKKHTNLICGHQSGMMLYPFHELTEKSPKIVHTNSNKKNMNTYDKNMNFIMAIPKNISNNSNPSHKEFLKCTLYQKCQFIPLTFYQTKNLNENIQFYEDEKSAFVPLQHIYLQRLQENSRAVMR